mmetsp:Transcript_48022/g.89920  ORF Transcript_48022/g.89920 Transcript_48022/m.89920 type:complete len:392 (+) Transcript_48022:77-1252(+)
MGVLRCALYLGVVSLAAAHGQLTVPLVRGDSIGRRESHEQRAPVYTLDGNRGGYSPTSMRCHDFLPDADGPQTTLQAGATFDVTWTMEAGHPGDCYFYVSYDADPSSVENFFKIASVPGCGAPDGLNIPSSVTTSVLLPAELPACEHCVLRWEWTGHQQVVNIEFYVQCADIKISSSASPTLPSPITAISGIEHLPASADGYRKVYNGEGPSEQYLVGPAVATFTPCDANTPGCLGLSNSGVPVDPGSTSDAPSSTSSAAVTSPAATGSGATPSTSQTSQSSAGEDAGAVSSLPPDAGIDSGADSCPLEGRGLPSFVSQCYCGFVGPDGSGCGPDDGTACWCRCCCHHRAGGCRYSGEAEPLDLLSHAPATVLSSLSSAALLISTVWAGHF